MSHKSDKSQSGTRTNLEYNLDVTSYTVGELYALYNLNHEDTIEVITEKFRTIVNDSEIAGHPDVFLSCVIHLYFHLV